MDTREAIVALLELYVRLAEETKNSIWLKMAENLAEKESRT